MPKSVLEFLNPPTRFDSTATQKLLAKARERVDQLGLQSVSPRGEQQPVDRGGATGVLVVELDLETQQVIDGVPVYMACRVVGQVVRQVGADDDQGLVAAPQPLEHLEMAAQAIELEGVDAQGGGHRPGSGGCRCC